MQINAKLIQKILDELAQENPRLDYVRGILETLLESFPQENKILTATGSAPMVKVTPVSSFAEEVDPLMALEYGTKAKLEEVKKLSEQSMQ